MTTSNYHKTKITLDGHEQKILDEVIDLLHDIWESAPENTGLEKDVYDAYISLSNLRIKAMLDSERNFCWKEETEIIE